MFQLEVINGDGSIIKIPPKNKDSFRKKVHDEAEKLIAALPKNLKGRGVLAWIPELNEIRLRG